MNIIEKGYDWICIRKPKWYELIIYFWIYPYPFAYKREWITYIEKGIIKKKYLDEFKSAEQKKEK